MLVSSDDLVINLEKRPYIILGNFDGIHLGHRELINKACSLAKENDALSMIYTFQCHPLTLINKCTAPELLMDNKRRLYLFQALGIDAVKFENFDEAMMKTSPEDFIKNIVNKYNPLGIVVGFNFRFGYKNSGDINSIKKLQNKYNYKLYVINAVKIGDNIVSSSLIRSFIKDGNLESANKFLGSPFSIYGKVIHGRKIGRQLDFPTVNLDFSDYIVPGTGVYYTNVLYKSVLYKGITDVGYNPTVSGSSRIKIETYILDFDLDIYDDNIRIFFIKKTRGEIKFDSLDGLKNQLLLDKEAARKQDFIDI